MIRFKVLYKVRVRNCIDNVNCLDFDNYESALRTYINLKKDNRFIKLSIVKYTTEVIK